MPVAKTPPTYEVDYVTLAVSVSIAEGLRPYLVDEAKRRDISIDTLVSCILSEDLARKRNQSRSGASKKAKQLNNPVSPIKSQ